MRRARHPVLTIACVVVLVACSSGGGSTSPAAQPSNEPTESSTPASPSTPSEPQEREEPALKVTSAFFGMHDGRISQGQLTELPIGSVRLWDSGTSWLHVELSPGQFDWTPVDTAVATAEGRGARPLLVLGQTPTFHATEPDEPGAYGPGATTMPRMDAWRRYVRAAAERYGDRVEYQIWNEANVINYWSGTPREMARLTVAASEEIRDVAPDATIVAPAFAYRLPAQQEYFEAFWSQAVAGASVARAVDVASLNLYPLAQQPPEAQVELLDKARQTLDARGIAKPIWNTEINYGLQGGPEPPAISAELQRAYVMRTYLLNAGHGVDRVYWYRWDISPITNTYLAQSGLATPTLAGQGYATVRYWLDGTSVAGCSKRTSGVVECTAMANAGVRRHFYWKPRGGDATVRTGKSTVSWTDASGSTTEQRGSFRLEVGRTPVMVTSRR